MDTLLGSFVNGDRGFGVFGGWGFDWRGFGLDWIGGCWDLV